MELQVVALAVDLTAHEAIESLRRAPKEALYYLYVTDWENHFVGVLTMRELLLAAPSEPISPLVRATSWPCCPPPTARSWRP